MKPPNILFISFAFYPQVGGIEINAEILTMHFHNMGYPIQVITAVPEGGSKKFPFPVFRNPGVKKLIELHKWADVVFENNPSLRLSWPRFFISSRSVVAIRGRMTRNTGKTSFRDVLKQMILRQSDGVIAVSSAIRDSFFPKATVIGNPYRTDFFQNLNRERKPLSFVFLGRLVSQKGVDIAIESFKQLNDQIAENSEIPTLKIIGNGPEESSLRQLVRKYQLEKQITFEGRKEGMALVEMLNTCRYILIPSDWEAFGNVALEGMACGCLPFVSDSGGLPDAVGKAGVVFKSGSAEALTQAILEIINNPPAEESYRKEMMPHLKEHSPERVVQKYLDVIERAYRNKKEIR